MGRVRKLALAPGMMEIGASVLRPDAAGVDDTPASNGFEDGECPGAEERDSHPDHNPEHDAEDEEQASQNAASKAALVTDVAVEKPAHANFRGA